MDALRFSVLCGISVTKPSMAQIRKAGRNATSDLTISEKLLRNFGKDSRMSRPQSRPSFDPSRWLAHASVRVI